MPSSCTKQIERRIVTSRMCSGVVATTARRLFERLAEGWDIDIAPR